ncbi:MAG: hypothetical protein KatS3mg002_0801 [Candidatus Woesearchaeota archaeon]|nr:MAG: hypothetical protein KatS3mg002_0801 [Candidatus Woesearchaeota archaeon]
MKDMEKSWKKQYEKRAKLNIPDYEKSFWNEEGQKQLLEVTLYLISKIKDAKTILDVGCGPGLYCEILKQKGYEVTGVDYSKNIIEYARKNYPHLKFIVADGYNLPFKDKQFDIVISIGALQCLVEHEKFIKELIRVSSKAVIISTLLKKKKSKNPMRTLREQLKNDPFPCREYHPSELIPIFEREGMSLGVYTKHNKEYIKMGGFIIAKHKDRNN